MPIIDLVAKFCQSISFAVNNNNVTIEILSGLNYKRWRSDIEFVLEMMDLDMALRENEPPKPTNESTEIMRAYYAKWERSNCLSLISIKRSIAEHLLRGILESNNAKEFLIAVANKYQTVDSHFSRAFPLDWRDSLFICEKLILEKLESPPILFLF